MSGYIYIRVYPRNHGQYLALFENRRVALCVIFPRCCEGEPSDPEGYYTRSSFCDIYFACRTVDRLPPITNHNSLALLLNNPELRQRLTYSRSESPMKKFSGSVRYGTYHTLLDVCDRWKSANYSRETACVLLLQVHHMR